MTSTSATRGLRAGLGVLRHRDLSVMLAGQFVSNAGTWMHNVTVPFVLYAATGSAVWVGLGGFGQYFPAMLASPLGGVLADRWSRRTVIVVGSTGQMLVALALALEWRGGSGSAWTTVGLVAVLGALSGLVLPAWQALLPNLVPREWLVRAISLNATVFNVSRTFGPALGGVLLARYGASTAFALNGVSYLAAIAAVCSLRTRSDRRPSGSGQVGSEMRAGLAYARQHPGLRLAWGLGFAGAALGAPVMALSAVMASEELDVSASKYGLLTAALGIGAAAGGLAITGWASTTSRARLTGVALTAYGLAVLLFGLAPTYALALAAMFLVGAGMVATNSTLNTSIQLKVDDAFRGRVMSIWAVSITGGLPLGSLVLGALAAAAGVRVALALAGGTLLAIVTVLRGAGRLAALDPPRP